MEVLLVVSILSILGAAGVGYYRNFAKSVEMKSVVQTLVTDLKDARARSMGGRDSLTWGIHAVNGTTDYYELFSTPTNYADSARTVAATTTLPNSVPFTDPAPSSSKDIIFTRVSGTTTASTLTVSSEGVTTVVTISGLGVIY